MTQAPKVKVSSIAPWRLTAALCPIKGPFAPLLFAGDLEEGLIALSELGYDAAELSLKDPDEVDKGWLIEKLLQLGLDVSSISTGRMFYEDGLSLTTNNADVRRASVSRLQKHVRFAAQLGSAVTIGGVRGKLPEGEEAAGIEKVAASLLREVAGLADSLGVTLLVEPINRYETNFINSAEACLAFLDEADLSNVKLLLDTFHMNIEEVSLERAIRATGHRLGYVHLVDSNRQPPGYGHTDFGPVMAALEVIGYSGYIGIEVLPLPDSRTAAMRGAQNTRQLVAEYSGRDSGSRQQEGNMVRQ